MRIMLFALAFLCATATAQVSAIYKPGELFVKISDNSNRVLPEFKEGETAAVNDQKLKAIIGTYGITGIECPFKVLKDEKLNRTYLIKFTATTLIGKLQEDLMGLGYLEYTEGVPDYKIEAVPNDPVMSTQWSLQKVHAYTAWNMNIAAGSVVVAVVDDEVMRNHQDLQAVIWQNPGEIAGNGIDDDNNGYIDDVNGYDVADNDNNPDPMPNGSNTSTHGTHVAGIVGAASNNSVGISSLANGAAGFNQVKIMGVKVQSNAYAGQPVLNNTYAGVVYAIAAHANVVNMSWGGGAFSNTYQNLFNTGYNAGIVFVAAAGNDNSGSAHYPSAYNHVISVASTTSTDAKSSFSNYGSTVDISAPGSNIYSCVAYTTSSYASFSGTSMASPLVASACALIKLKNPGYTATQVEDCLKQGADNIAPLNPGYNNLLGAGRLNAYNALLCAPCTANANFTTPNNNYTFYVNSNVQFTASNNNGSQFTWVINGNVYSGASTSYTFSAGGYYNIKLIARSPLDSLCRDTVMKVVTIIDTLGNICIPLQGGNWHFGHNAGLTFTTVPPTAINNPNVHIHAGSTTVSDKCGNILFFTNGVKVWDRDAQLMPNIANFPGDTVAFQVLAVPKPGAPGVYGVFTTRRADMNAAEPSQMELYYSEIDMNLPGNGTATNPKGDVSFKGTSPLDDNVTEKMTIVRQANGVDYWFIIHDFGNSDFKVYLYDHNGLAANPIVSTTGAPNVLFGNGTQNFSPHDVKMYMKASPDGTRLALTHYRQGNFTIGASDPIFEVFDFDRATGMVSNGLPIYNIGSNYSLVPYSSWQSKNGTGLEFSPNGKYLYGIAHNTGDGSIVAQYDLTSHNTAQINSSYKIVVSVPLSVAMTDFRYVGLQLGPDEKIYVSRIGAANYYSPGPKNTYLGAINSPNNSAANNACNYVENQVYLGSTPYTLFGFPTFAQYQFPEDTLYIASNDSCVAQPVNFTAVHTDFCDVASVSYVWNFNDPASGASNTSILKNPIHQFTASGTYQVKLVITSACKTDSVTKTIALEQCQTCNALANVQAATAGLKYCQNWQQYVKGFMDGSRYYKWVVDGVDKPMVDSLAAGQYNFFLPDSLSDGTHSICLFTYADAQGGCRDSSCMQLGINCSTLDNGAIDEATEYYRLRQTGKNIWLDYGFDIGQSRNIGIINAVGQWVVVPQNLEGAAGSTHFNLQYLPAGVYQLLITGGGNSYVKKFVLY